MARYCIIGAGAAGIGALHTLLGDGFTVDCFEQTDRVGGHWHTDYDALHLITSRNVTAYDGFPMPQEYPLFPSRDEMRAYLELFAKEFGLYDKITFGTTVLAVEPAPSANAVGSAGWRVRTNHGDEGVYDGVLVANGHLWDKKVPVVPGEFTGLQLHSSEYQNTGGIDGTRVLVVGSGNSGCDLAVDAAQHRFETCVSVRQGHIYQPKTFFGRPRSELAFLQGLDPDELDVLTRLLIKLSVGTWEDYPGMPKPQQRTLAEGAPVVNNLLLYWIQHGRITVVPDPQRFDGKTVHFTDGTSREFDTILWATGFNATLPFLSTDLLQWQDGVPLRLGGATVPAGLEKLYFVGLIAPRGPQPPVYPAQTRVIAQMLRAHEHAGPNGAPVTEWLASRQQPEWRIDILRPLWQASLDEAAAIVAEHTAGQLV